VTVTTYSRPASAVALVTGAASGIGRACASVMGLSGWHTAGLDLNASDTDLSLRVDVSDRAAVLAAVDEVLAQARTDATAVMCAESLWWRCHRRLLADFVTAARGVPVRHLLHDGRIEEHRLSPGLRRRDDGLLVYDAGQPTLL